jgi:hypothetical protein
MEIQTIFQEIEKKYQEILNLFKNILSTNKNEIYQQLYKLEQQNSNLFKILYSQYKFDDFLYYIVENDFGRIKHFINEYKMNINHVNENGESFLIRALKNDKLLMEHRKALIVNGINLNIVDNFNHNALYYAEEFNYKTSVLIIKSFLKN